jgi:glycosyltransferase 2 family protein
MVSQFCFLMLKNRLIITIITIVLFYLGFILYSDIDQFSYSWNDLTLYFIPLILIIHIFSIVLRVWRQKILFESLDIHLSLNDNIKLQFASLSLMMTPGGLGQVIKSYFLKEKYSQSYNKTIPVTILERYHDLLSVVSLLLIFSFFTNYLETQIIILITAPILIVIYIVMKNRKLFFLGLRILPKKGFIKKVSENGPEFYDSLDILIRKKTFFYSWIVSMFPTIVGGIGFYLSFLAFNLNFNLIDAMIISYIPIIVGTISFIPGGIGITEVSMLGLLIDSGLTLSIASALTLFIRLTSVWTLTFIGIICTRFFIGAHTSD